MSDNWLLFLPTRPDYVPAPQAQQAARDLLAELLPDAEVTASESPQIEFVDPGGNWEGVRCPLCHADIEDWWFNAMDTASESDFENLAVTLPCCGAAANLNDLDYVWPAGLARFVLEAHHPNVKDLEAPAVKRLEALLGCSLRRVWRHL